MNNIKKKVFDWFKLNKRQVIGASLITGGTVLGCYSFYNIGKNRGTEKAKNKASFIFTDFVTTTMAKHPDSKIDQYFQEYYKDKMED